MAPKSETPKRTKQGLRIISADDDLMALFDESNNSKETDSHPKTIHQLKKQPTSVTCVQNALTSDGLRESRSPLTSRKIPVSVQNTTADSGNDDENFEDMLEASLSKMKINDILKQKNGDVDEESTSIQELVKSHPPPQMQIDLHGCTRKEAKRKADSFIYSASYKGLKTVRIIVGKGIHSTGDAVLPDVIETKMIALKKERVVLSYCWEKRKKRKSGAMIVYLVQS